MGKSQSRPQQPVASSTEERDRAGNADVEAHTEQGKRMNGRVKISESQSIVDEGTTPTASKECVSNEADRGSSCHVTRLVLDGTSPVEPQPYFPYETENLEDDWCLENPVGGDRTPANEGNSASIKPDNIEVAVSVTGENNTRSSADPEHGALVEYAKSESGIKPDNIEAASVIGDNNTRCLESPEHEALVEYAESVESGFSSIDAIEDDHHRFHGEADNGHVADTEWEDVLYEEDLMEPARDGERRPRKVDEPGTDVAANLLQSKGLESMSGYVRHQVMRTELLVNIPLEEYIPYSKYICCKEVSHEDLPERQEQYLSGKRFTVEKLKHQVFGHLAVSEQEQHSSAESGAVVGEEEFLSSDSESWEITKARIPKIVIEDYDAVNGTADDGSNESPAFSQTDVGKESERTFFANESKAVGGLLVVPKEIHSSCTETLKRSTSSECSTGHGCRRNKDSEESSKQGSAGGTIGEQELFHLTTDRRSAVPEDKTNCSQPVAGRPVPQDPLKMFSTSDAEKSLRDTATTDPHSTQTTPDILERKGESDDSAPHTLISPSEASPKRQTAMDTCLPKTPPYASPEEDLVCEHCGQFFVLVEHLQAHREGHPVVSEYKTLRCGGCGAQFRHMTDLYLHLDLTRRREGTRCPRCRQWFATCEDLYRHRQIRRYRLDGKGVLLGQSYGFALPRRNLRHLLRRL